LMKSTLLDHLESFIVKHISHLRGYNVKSRQCFLLIDSHTVRCSMPRGRHVRCEVRSSLSPVEGRGPVLDGPLCDSDRLTYDDRPGCCHSSSMQGRSGYTV
jgi:hypothetical protein